MFALTILIQHCTRSWTYCNKATNKEIKITVDHVTMYKNPKKFTKKNLHRTHKQVQQGQRIKEENIKLEADLYKNTEHLF